jgi:hypothetical protein
MDWHAMRRRRRLRRGLSLLALGRARVEILWLVITAWMLAGLLLLPVVSGAMFDRQGEVSQDPERQAILQAHPEWPPEVRAAVMAGIICIGMPAEMVRAAWGSPTRISGGGPGQRETWHYEGRPRAVERLGGQETDDAGARGWTVAFSDGRVVGWTD